MAAMLDNLPLYTIGRRGKPNTLGSLVTKHDDGSDGVLDDSIVLDVDFGLAKRRLMAIKESDPDGTRDCVLVQVEIAPTGKTVYDPESPEEAVKTQVEQRESTGFCSQTLLDPVKVEEAWKSVSEYTLPKQESVERSEKPSFLEKLKKILF